MHCSANGMHAFEVPFCMVYNFIINIHFNVMHVCFVDSCWTYRHSQESTNVYVDVHLVIYEEDHTDKSRSLDRSMVPDKVFFFFTLLFFLLTLRPLFRLFPLRNVSLSFHLSSSFSLYSVHSMFANVNFGLEK